MTVCTATEQDLPAIMEIETLAFTAPTREDEKTFRRRLAVFPEGFLVLKETEESAASGYFCSELWDAVPLAPSAFSLDHDASRTHVTGGTVLYISSLALLPDMRGHGTGRFFLQQCLTRIHTAQPQITDLVLLVNSNWPAARHLYTTMGFRQYGAIPGFFHDGDGIMMKK